MTGVVVEFGRAWRAEGDWSVEEREAIARLADRLMEGAPGLMLSFGLSDARDPWCAVLDADEEVVLHVARIDGRVILHRTRDDLILRSGAPAALAAVAARPVAEAVTTASSHEREGPVAPPPAAATPDALSTSPQVRPTGDAAGVVNLPGPPRPVASAPPALAGLGAGAPAAAPAEFRLESVAHHDLAFPPASAARPQLAPLLLFPTPAAETPAVPLSPAPLAHAEPPASAIILAFPVRPPTTGTVMVAGSGPAPELPPVLGWGDAAAPRGDARPVLDPHVAGGDPHVTGDDPPPDVPIVGQPLPSQAA